MQFSPDGLYYWDGARWVNAVSPDGRFRWDGRAWVAVQGAFHPPGADARPARRPTSWTRPLQYVVAAYIGISGLYTLTLPFWMGGVMTQAINQGIQRQESLNPTVSPPPAGFTDTMSSVMGGVLWFSAVVGFAICVFAVVAVTRRWTWAFYVLLVLFGLGTLSLPTDIIYLSGGSSISSVNGGFTMPTWTYQIGIISGALDAAIFTWMLVSLVKRGPWGMARPAG
ncbi:MAG TPA: hypothetical protein VGG31_07260 [Candidatus Dormibacteraeota bacterium]